MKFFDVMKMLKAGFTADEIRKMDQDPVENNPQNSQENPQEEEPAAAPEQTSEQDPVAELKELFQGMKESNDNLAKVIQASNLQNASFGSNPVDDINKKAEDALLSIIRPDMTKEVK